MKTKNSLVFLGVMFLLIMIFSQVSFAEYNESDTGEDFSTPSLVEVNSSGDVNVNINTSQNIQKEDLTLKLNRSDTISDINDFELSNNKIKFTLTDTNFAQAVLHVNYKTVNTQTTLKKIVNINIEALNTQAKYQSGTYQFKVSDIDSGKNVENKTLTARYMIRGSQYVATHTQSMTTDSNGIATFYLNKINNPNTQSGNLPVGEFNITVSGDDPLKGNVTSLMTVKKCDVIITPLEYKKDKGSSEKFKVNVRSKNTGEGIKGCELTLNVVGSKDIYYKMVTDSRGIGEIDVSSLDIGEYPTTITASDTNINNATAKTTIVINKIKVKINIESLVSYYNSGRTAIIKVTNAKTSKALPNIQINITVDGLSYYYRTDKNGRIEFSTSLDIGKHTLIFKTAENIYTSDSITKKINVKKAEGKFTPSTKTYYYNTGKYMTVKLTNTKNKKGIFNAKIHFKIRTSKTQYSNYYGTTQKDGKIKFNIDLKPGTYKVQISGDDKKNFKAKTLTAKITIKKSPLKLTTKSSKKEFEIKVLNKKTKKAVKGVKLKVKVNKKIYNVKSNSKGICKINLKKGVNKIQITAQNKYYTLNTYKRSVKV